MAVMGILLMNIVALGMPSYAYVDPTSYGTNNSADWAAWTISYVIADGKFRALFTMLFGASIVMIAERAEARGDGPGPVQIHFSRMFWLFIIGMIHAWCFWYGDILVQYAIAGMLMFLLWRWQPRALWLFFATMLTLHTAGYIGQYAALAPIRTAAMAPAASPRAMSAWNDEITLARPTRAETDSEIQGYRGDVQTVFATRAKSTALFQTVITPLTMPEVFAFMTLGILLFRNGFFSGVWSSRSYALTIGAGYLVAVPLTAMLASSLRTAGFDPVTQALCDTGSLLLRPFIALAHAAVVIVIARSNRAESAMKPIEAIGRMALSNYLGTTLIATTLFYGYGFGWFGYLGRAELYIVVLAIWTVMLWWSPFWLAHFNYGPAEWLWRSLARGSRQPMRRQIRPKP